MFSRERVYLISFWFSDNLNYEWRSCNSGVCVGPLKYLDSAIHLHVLRLDRFEEVQGADSLPDLCPATQSPSFQQPVLLVSYISFYMYQQIQKNIIFYLFLH